VRNSEFPSDFYLFQSSNSSALPATQQKHRRHKAPEYAYTLGRAKIFQTGGQSAIYRENDRRKRGAGDEDHLSIHTAKNRGAICAPGNSLTDIAEDNPMKLSSHSITLTVTVILALHTPAVAQTKE